MKLNHLALPAALLLAACSQDPAGVRLTHEAATAAPATTPAVAAKTEPVFYNGHTYQVAFNPQGGGMFSLAIAGMGAGQGKDAAALASSTLHHFACKDSQKAVLQAAPAFEGGSWKASGHCA
ncbi:MAG: hypothetical protein KGO53_01425 [Alphaproteobacteria bacterium]|nr:hypothetical protein [Alphaproteobacteria bacterium]